MTLHYITLHYITLPLSSQAELVRTDYFPGLGWMMARAAWDGWLRAAWPVSKPAALSTGWDHWLRAQVGGRLGFLGLNTRAA